MIKQKRLKKIIIHNIMKGIAINKLGRTEKNKNVKEGDCIFPFKYKKNTHTECVETERGDICATSVSERQTLKTYGYCKLNTSLKKTKSFSPNGKTRKHSKESRVSKESKDGKESANSNESKSNSNFEKLKPFSPDKDSSAKMITRSKSNEKSNEIVLNNSHDKLNMTTSKRLNEIFITALSELNDIFMRKGEPFRARAYKKAEETILLHHEDIYDHLELKGKPNIGDTILSKLKELQETGTLRILERERNDPLQIFTQIHGIGPKKAEQLIKQNVKTLEELHQRTDLLNDNQKTGLKHFDDIKQRIPRKVIDTYRNMFEDLIESFNDDKISLEIVGSYRRGAMASGDIDVIISHEEDNKNVFPIILNKLKDNGTIVEFLSKGSTKSLTVTKIDGDIARRVDFLYSPPSELAFAILYFTGSKGFNTVMRHRALQLGYSLNEHGLSKLNGKEKEKITFMTFPTELSIFDFLKMDYKEPYERKDGRAVVSKEGTPIITKKVQEKTYKTVKKSLKSKSEGMKPSTVLQPTTRNSINKEDFVNKFRDEGIKYLDNLNESAIVKIVKDANDAFFNNVSFLTDSEYDIIKEYVENKYPQNKLLDEIGAPVIERNKVKLPYYMGSMDKIKPDTDVIDKWKMKYPGPYVVSAKLDGVSGLYSTEGGVSKLYTRGNGTIGQDISYFIPYLKLPKNENITIRGEFIVNRHTFEAKYEGDFSNPRNFVSGLINSKNVDAEKFADVEFVAYEVIVPNKKPSEQMRLLQSMNVETVLYESKENVSNESLSEILVNWRNNYQFESDGIIVSDDNIYPRKERNPEHSFAFKMVLSEQIAEAKVVDVIWNVSKNGLIKPKIQIEPVTLGGAKIQYATAHNAATVVSQKLGVGAVVKIIRSGDVIPYIMETITPAEVVKMPDMDYEWNETKVDIELLDKENNEEILTKNITGFFTGIKVDGLSSGNVVRIMKAGFNSIPKIIEMSKEDFMSVEGFKTKMAEKIHTSIKDKLSAAKLYIIMSGSNIFGQGFGEKKIKLIMEEYSDILRSNETPVVKVMKLENVKGMAQKTAEAFVEKIPLFIQFLKDTHLMYKIENVETIKAKEYDTEHELYGKSIVFTGIRDKPVMETLESKYNVKLSSSVSKNTYAVIAKSKDEDSSKLNKARELNVTIYDIDEFKSKYSM